jgi:DNA modification methylase
VNRIITGDCRDTMRELIAQGVKVQTVVTSPPYWGLRNYGIPPTVWGGDPECGHRWSGEGRWKRSGGTARSTLGDYNNGLNAETLESKNDRQRLDASTGAFCEKCGAWKGDLGLEPTPWMWVAHIVEVFDLVYQLLADDGTVWLNLGDCHASDGGVLTPHNGLPKNRRMTQDTVSGAVRWRTGASGNKGNGAAGEVLCRPNHVGAGGWADTEASGERYRIFFEGVKQKDMMGMPWAAAFALRAAGWYLRSDIIWHKKNPMPGSYKDRPTTTHEYVFLLAKNGTRTLWWQAKDTREWSKTPDLEQTVLNPKGEEVPRWLGFNYLYQWDEIAEECSPNTHARLSQDIMNQRGSDRAHEGARRNGKPMKAVPPAGYKDAGRELQGLKHSEKFGRGPGWRKSAPGVTPKSAGLTRDSGIRSNESFHTNHSGIVERRNKRTVWLIGSEPFKGPHFATFPKKLVEPCVLAGSRPGDIVFDPFMGSGTVAEVASKYGRQYLGCELGAENEELQRQRIAQPGLVLA